MVRDKPRQERQDLKHHAATTNTRNAALTPSISATYPITGLLGHFSDSEQLEACTLLFWMSCTTRSGHFSRQRAFAPAARRARPSGYSYSIAFTSHEAAHRTARVFRGLKLCTWPSELRPEFGALPVCGSTKISQALAPTQARDLNAALKTRKCLVERVEINEDCT
jgi:hypothetical protein